MFLLLVLILALPAQMHAQDYAYTIDNGTITITGYIGFGGAVIIPGTINGLPVTRIDFCAFRRCFSLMQVTLPNSVTSIGDWVFSGCSSLTQVTLPNSVTSIGDWVFSGCSSLTQVTLPNSVTNIGHWVFSGCSSLTQVTIPNSVTSIGYGAFGGSDGLVAIQVEDLNESYASLDGVLFDKSLITLLQYPGGKAGGYTVPDSVTSVGDWAFSGCSSLTQVTLPGSITNIGNWVFSGCSSLTQVTLPNEVNNIGDGTFSHCSSLTQVNLPASVINIGYGAFEDCSSLTQVTIPNSVTSIGYGAFGGCDGLVAIHVEDLNESYASLDGVLFNKSLTALVQYPGGKAGSYTVPDRVTRIGNDAFDGCSSLTQVTIPNSVTSIESGAFHGCSGLTNVTIGSGVVSIGNSAFAFCDNLAGVYFQGNAPRLEEGNIFYGDTKATVYYLPGTTGWGMEFGGRWAVLSPTSLRIVDFGILNGRFGFTITGPSNIAAVVEAGTNLAAPVWSPVGTNTLTDGSSYFSDPEWANHPTRFYRLR